jgi:hypothetical protein
LPVKINKDWCYIVHIARDGSAANLYKLPLADGWRDAQLARQVYDAKKTKHTVEIVGRTSRVSSFETEVARVLEIVAEGAEPPRSAPPDDDIDPRHAALSARVEVLRVIEGGLAALSAAWPHGVPTLKQSTDHTAEQLDAAEAAIVAAEAKVQAPFPDDDNTPVAPWPVAERAPRPPVIEEGRKMDNVGDFAAVELLRSRLHLHLSDVSLGMMLKQWLNEVAGAGYSLNLRDNPTVRRFELCRFVEAIAPLGEEAARAVVAKVIDSDEPLHPTVTFGSILCTLTIEEARRCADLVTPALSIVFDDEGKARVAA